MKMTAANSGPIDIIGALAMRISGTSPSKETLETRQIVYFTTSTDRLFLSKQACVALGIISSHFPTIGERSTPNSTRLESSTVVPPSPPVAHTTGTYKCPQRQTPPPFPTSLPFPATEEN